MRGNVVHSVCCNRCQYGTQLGFCRLLMIFRRIWFDEQQNEVQVLILTNSPAFWCDGKSIGAIYGRQFPVEFARGLDIRDALRVECAWSQRGETREIQALSTVRFLGAFLGASYLPHQPVTHLHLNYFRIELIIYSIRYNKKVFQGYLHINVVFFGKVSENMNESINIKLILI